MTRNGAFPWLSSSSFSCFLFLLFSTLPSHQEDRASVTFDLSPILFGSLVKDSKSHESKDNKLPGCIECGEYRCPENPSKCLLGSVSDPCGCCKAGICARLGGEPCWNSSITEPYANSRKDGFCARNYFCQLRTDLQKEDVAETICICMEQTPACGSDQVTYETPCALHEKAMRLKSHLSLKLQQLGPCPTRPWIVSYSEHVVSNIGQLVLLSCETKGFPVPDIFWEFHSPDGKKVLKLQTNEEYIISVEKNIDPKSWTKTSWLQLPRLTKDHVGTYHCIANNSIGEAGAASFVSIV
ncbi:PREDICTED: insulin-like growth factor-binding protein-related protein 1 [Polistes dominula]|uniref:Insulin-like growth factor-binding protein-related protein 1 n=1 Tax=Polistes dominula TaxID=743375 RepID=A0ABM1I0K6_POLDO|nr:PREDICTED: insulin-like growth factor-binding protein-related protein 1 [Polistes dominula]